LAAEIREMRGQALLWHGQLADADQHRSMVQRFGAPVEREYRDLLSGLRKKSANRSALAKRYQQLQARDYFQSELGQKVRAALTIGKQGARR
jgi:hypothetical protein